jgi:hypothetical protein
MTNYYKDKDVPWHEKIKAELESRDRMCAQMNPKDVYKRPSNAFSFKNVEEFKKNHPFNRRNSCRFENTDLALLSMDPYGRFYSDVNKKILCDNVGGRWSPASVNRKNRYENGVCWKKNDDMHCSQHEVKELLRPGVDKLPNKDNIIATGSRKCNQDKKCSWVKLNKSYDCFSREASEKIRKRVVEPPKEMPNDITGNNGHIEQFLYDFYARGKIKDPKMTRMTNWLDVFPPATTQLFGQGNRCTSAPATVASAATPAAAASTIRKQNTRLINASEKADDETDDVPAMTPSLPQSVINMIMKNFANKSQLGETITNRGLLAWHSVGSGKTCTAAGVMDGFWKSKRDIIFASSLDALASNPPSNFQECLYNLFPQFQKPPYVQAHAQPGQGKDASLKIIATEFEKRKIRFLSFAKLSNRVKKTQESGILRQKAGNASKKTLTKKDVKSPLKPTIHADDLIDLNNTILIIDEVHNLFRPLPTQKAQHDYLKAQLMDPTKFPGLKIVILSGTPGDNVEDIMVLLNMIRDPTHPVIKPPQANQQSIDQFKREIRGLISYFEMSGDRTRFPQINDLEHILAPMGTTQFDKYIEAYHKTIKERKTTDYNKLANDNQINKYWGPARKYSNMLYSLDKSMKLTEFSSKLPMLLEKIKSYGAEKHYVYSAFSHNMGQGWGSQGILAIANAMEKFENYEKFTLAQVKFDANGDVTLPPKKQRFLLVTLKELGEGKDGKVSGAAGEKLKKMLKVFNHPANKYGEYIHVMLASNAFNEGIDLKAVRHIHFFEPLVTMASDKQTIGRAARYCSHADLDKDLGQWQVSVHRYMSYFPVNVEIKTKNTGAQQVSTEHKNGPTSDEMTKISTLENNASAALKQADELAAKAKNIKLTDIKDAAKKEQAKEEKADYLKKSKEAKERAKASADEIKLVNKNIKTRDGLAAPKKTKSKKTKETKERDISDIKLVDEFIFNESRARMKEILVLYQSMKESAVDCRLLQKFHALSGNVTVCAPYDAL